MNAPSITFQRFTYSQTSDQYGSIAIDLPKGQSTLSVSLVRENGTGVEVDPSQYSVMDGQVVIGDLEVFHQTYGTDFAYVFIQRKTPLVQSATFQNGRYLDVRKVEGALDDLSMQIQDIAGRTEGVVRVPMSEMDGEAPRLPSREARAGMVLGFDEEGNIVTPYSVSGLRNDLEGASQARDQAKDYKEAAEMARDASVAAQTASENAQGLAEGARNDAYQAKSEAAEISAGMDVEWRANIKPYIDQAVSFIMAHKVDAVNAVETYWTTEIVPRVNLLAEGVQNLSNDANDKLTELRRYFQETVLATLSQQLDAVQGYADDARGYKANAETFADNAAGSADQSKAFMQQAKEYAEIAHDEADKAKRYYIPSVDDEGNLSFTPTRADMAMVEPVNVYGDTLNKVLRDIEDFKFGYAEYSKDDNYIHFYSEEGGQEIASVGPIVGGTGTGGGGSSTSSTLTATALDFGSSKTVASGADCILTFDWSSYDGNSSTGAGSITVNVEGKNVIVDREIQQGVVSINLKEYLKPNQTNNVRMTIRDLYGSSRIFVIRVKCVAVSLTSDFDETRIYSDVIEYSCVPVGDCQKELHVMVDGVELASKATSANNRWVPYTIPAQTHGAHEVKVWLTAEIDGNWIPLEPMTYNIICTEEGHEETIIAVRVPSGPIKQYHTTRIRYQVWSLTAEPFVTKLDPPAEETIKVNHGEQEWPVNKDEVGEYRLTLSCEGVSREIVLNVGSAGLDIHPATENLELYLSSKNHVKGAELEWGFGDVQCSFGGFNGISDGWQLDSKGIPVMRLRGDARITIPLAPFGKYLGTSGKTIEFEFATSEVFDYDAVIMSCLSGGIGIQATAQAVTLYSAEDSLYTQYKEDEHIRVTFVISRASAGRIVYCYINGIMSGAYRYSTTDTFEQADPVQITLGSSDCTTDIYAIRVYDTDISRFEVVDNWLIDMQDGEELLMQYNRNQIYENDVVTPEKLLSVGLPVLVIDGRLPANKGNEQTVSGYFTDPDDSSRSFDFTGATIDVQGTSSKNYPRKNYKIVFNNGFLMGSGYTAAGYSINGGLPVDTFTFKADYASSEGANNVELVRLYNECVEYRSPLQADDTRVRQGIDGFPIAIFNTNGGDTYFLGKYNFNNDKSTAQVFGLTEGDESWEITDNGSARQLFMRADFNSYDEIKEEFESRYPEDEALVSITQLKAMMEWVASTNRDVDEAQKAQRLQKFHDEFEDWFDLNDSIFYYLFTEVFLMVDSRAKNAFPTIYRQDGKWVWLPYDMDTAIGIDNGGRLRFSYNLEDTDTFNGNDVFNGQKSVFWNNLRDAFGPEIRDYYEKNLRNLAEFSWDEIEKRFEEHQGKWPVALWNEDAYFKYIEPLQQDGEDRLYMLQGSKEAQRKWWLFNRFRYMDSKYNSNDAKQRTITFRACEKNDGDGMEFTVIPYADIYARVEAGAKHDQKRAPRGQVTELHIADVTNPRDNVINIFSADQLRSVGDLSGFKPEQVNISKAINLQALKVGDSDPSYENPNLNQLVLGENRLLKSIDARNCTGLNGAVEAEGCTSLEYAYFDNTAITSLTLGDAIPLKGLHLPSSVRALVLRNLTQLEDFVLDDASNVTRLWMENPTPYVSNKVLPILHAMPDRSRVRAIGLRFKADTEEEILGFFRNLDRFRGLDANGEETEEKAQVSGVAEVDIMTYDDKIRYEKEYKNLTIEAAHLMCRVNFYDTDGESLLYSTMVEYGADAYYTGAVPTKPANPQFTFSFNGWASEPEAGGVHDVDILKNVRGNINVYASYVATLRSYTVTWVNDNGAVLKTEVLPYGATPAYTGSTPVTSDTSGDYGDFKGWSPEVGSVVGDVTYKATYISLASVTRKILTGDIVSFDNDEIETVGSYAFYSCLKLKSVNMPECTSIGSYAFAYCYSYTAGLSYSFPKCSYLGDYAFYNTWLNYIDFPECKKIGAEVVGYSNCRLSYISLPKCEIVGANAFARIQTYIPVELPECREIGSSAFYNAFITKMSLPKCENIYESAFRTCGRLSEIFIGTSNCKLSASTAITGGITSSTGSIYVPRAYVDAYKESTNWKYFANRIFPYDFD